MPNPLEAIRALREWGRNRNKDALLDKRIVRVDQTLTIHKNLIDQTFGQNEQRVFRAAFLAASLPPDRYQFSQDLYNPDPPRRTPQEQLEIRKKWFCNIHSIDPENPAVADYLEAIAESGVHCASLCETTEISEYLNDLGKKLNLKRQKLIKAMKANKVKQTTRP